MQASRVPQGAAEGNCDALHLSLRRVWHSSSAMPLFGTLISVCEPTSLEHRRGL